MTPHAPISDHADPTVPDGNDFPPAPPPTPLSRPCHRQLQGQKQRGEWGGRLVNPQGTWTRGRWATREWRKTVTPTLYLFLLIPCYINDENAEVLELWTCWRACPASGCPEVPPAAFYPLPRLWKSCSHPWRHFCSISHSLPFFPEASR